MALAAFYISKEVDVLNTNSARRNFLTTLADTLVLPNIENIILSMDLRQYC